MSVFGGWYAQTCPVHKPVIINVISSQAIAAVVLLCIGIRLHCQHETSQKPDISCFNLALSDSLYHPILYWYKYTYNNTKYILIQLHINVSISTNTLHRYQIAENIDAQLKRMTEDLKEVIDHLNTGAGSQDNTDPVSLLACVWLYRFVGLMSVHLIVKNYMDQHRKCYAISFHTIESLHL